ncbi:MAG: M24 family metallopeptidase [Pseudomonadota bacterium]
MSNPYPIWTNRSDTEPLWAAEIRLVPSLEAFFVMRHAIRSKVSEALRRSGVDAYIGVTPANIVYLAGFQSPFLELSWQMTGTDLVIIPAAIDCPPALIVSEYAEPEARAATDIADIRTYSLWTECRDFRLVSGREDPRPAILQLPEQYRPDDISGLIEAIFDDRGLSPGRIGTDMVSMRHGSFLAFQRAFPAVEWVDCEPRLYESRRIKAPFEIKRLKQAAALFDEGVGHAAARLQAGQTLGDIRAAFEAGVQTGADRMGISSVVQDTFFFPHLGTGHGAPAQSGDIVKLDCGVKVDGYWSDACRHVSIGPPSDTKRLIHEALLAGHAAARARIGPGAVLGDIYDAAIRAVRKAGLPNYSRGHVGHSIGLDGQIEEPPFIGPNPERLEPGMVICLELPYYPPDVGGFNIEDMILITEAGYEMLTHLPRDLMQVG